ncbi:MAG: adenosylcobinamide-GDP ribazoletransferase [Syntrophorhabdaceae bacterium]|nr:adenosylcobinamide-GDP ribazoletransferase [Syntrophorhabdaceae bacterium]MDD4195893.1 adenosylcobinamide-GDP ribazoletransferase [Syntrophorhabdaceae bacterium]
MKRIIAAFQFLTIIPIRTRRPVSTDDLRWSAVFFPFVGFFQGLFLAAAAFLFLKLLSPSVTSVLVIILYLAMNGCFHQDGLSDTFDALSVRSTGDQEQDRQKRLAVMRDSTSGPVGITAIAVFLLLKYALLKEMLQMPAYGLNPVIMLMPMISAWSMTMMMPGAKSARNDGLGKIFLGRIHAPHVILACTLIFLLSGIIYLVSYGACPFTMRNFVPYFLAALLASLLAGYTMRALFNTRFGGLTGDSLGCINEVSEVIVLLIAVALLERP